MPGIGAQDGSMLFFFCFASLSHTRLRIHNDGYCGYPPSSPLLRTEEMGIEEHLTFMALLSSLLSASLLNASCTNTCAIDVSYYSSLFEGNTQDVRDSHRFSHPIQVAQLMRHNQDEG
jgi:hypothetical protein